MRQVFLGFVGLAMLAGCAMSSDVMDAGGGYYLISAHASAVRGGTTGANSIAYNDANKFCMGRQPGTHAIVAQQGERDVYQSSAGGYFNQNGGSFGGSTVAAGNVNMRFRCGS